MIESFADEHFASILAKLEEYEADAADNEYADPWFAGQRSAYRSCIKLIQNEIGVRPIPVKEAQDLAYRWLLWRVAPVIAEKIVDPLDDLDLVDLFEWVGKRTANLLRNQSAVIISDELGLTFNQSIELREAAGL
jgi:hypothetical protein